MIPVQPGDHEYQRGSGCGGLLLLGVTLHIRAHQGGLPAEAVPGGGSKLHYAAFQELTAGRPWVLRRTPIGADEGLCPSGKAQKAYTVVIYFFVNTYGLVFYNIKLHYMSFNIFIIIQFLLIPSFPFTSMFSLHDAF